MSVVDAREPPRSSWLMVEARLPWTATTWQWRWMMCGCVSGKVAGGTGVKRHTHTLGLHNFK